MNESSKLHVGVRTTPWIKEIVAECLTLDPSEIDVGVPLRRYGLDSLAAIQVAGMMAERLKQPVPDSLLREYQTIEALESYVGLVQNGKGSSAFHATNRFDQISPAFADCLLPSDIQPNSADPAEEPRAILVTGATGFLGQYLVRALLNETTADVYCLVRRGATTNGGTRLAQALLSIGLPAASFKSRLHVIEGDLEEPTLGLSPVDSQRLTQGIDAIYHCAAEVDWVSPYSQLRPANVRGTIELLRLASTSKRKAFHFVSSLAVCYSTTGPREVYEWEDMLPYLGGLYLGYAQTKCVSETLVRRAAERGLPVTIYRPSLISGDARSGVSNTDDILSRVIKACIHMRCAPDLDWILDCCPVDFVAHAIVRLSEEGRSALRVFHLTNHQPRHWRELILWMNMFGYPTTLIPYRSWLEQLEKDSGIATHPLHPLRSFFFDRPDGHDGLTLPELYEEGRRSRVSTIQTRQALSDTHTDCPPLNAQLLDTYFSSYTERGFLPRPPQGVIKGDRDVALPPDARMLERILQRYCRNERMRVLRMRQDPMATNHSIISELTSWKYRSATGLLKYAVKLDDGSGTAPRLLSLAAKIKPKDRLVMEVGAQVAAMCGDALGQAFARHVNRIGLAGSHLRELGIYEQDDRRFTQYVPTVYGTVRDDEKQTWVILLEWLEDVVLKDAVEDISGWNPSAIEAAVRGLADLHSVWYGKEPALLAKDWLGPISTSTDMASMHELWTALASHSKRYFGEWVDATVPAIQRNLVATVGEWWPDFENMPRTLIHNDFNPRNILFRKTDRGLRLCAYDWELATLGVPQHDLAELLCFILSPRATKEEVLAYLNLHRTCLQEASGQAIDPSTWVHGFRLALRDLILNRLPMYTMIHTYRPQKFLGRVIRTWNRLYGWFD